VKPSKELALRQVTSPTSTSLHGAVSQTVKLFTPIFIYITDNLSLVAGSGLEDTGVITPPQTRATIFVCRNIIGNTSGTHTAVSM
jgi:hypothetical protein